MKHQDKQTEAMLAGGAIIILLVSLLIYRLGTYLIQLELGI